MEKRPTERVPWRRFFSSQNGSGLIQLRVLCSLLLLLQAVAGFFPGPCLWGVNHLAYWPLLTRILWPLLGLVTIWTPLSGRVGHGLIRYIGPFILGRRLMAYLIIPILGILCFWLFRCRSHFLGDGWLLGEVVARGFPFHGYDFVDFHLHARLFNLLRLRTETDAFRLFAVASVLAGAFYLAVAAWSARNLSRDWGERVLLYALLVFFAPVQIFMGYVECYSILMVFMLLLLASLALHYRQGAPAFLPAVAAGLGLVFHLDALFLAPLLVAVVFWPPKPVPAPIGQRFLAVAGPLLAAVLLGSAVYLLGGYNREWFEIEFIRGHRFQRILTWYTGPHSLLSLVHWKDIANLSLLLAGVPLAMLVAARLQMWRPGSPPPGQPAGPLPRETRVLLGGCLWLGALMSLLHMKLGVVRDWDLFAAQAPIFAMAAFLVWSHITRGRAGGRLVGIVVVTAVLFTLPWFWLNAGEARSLQRFRDVISDQPRFARAYAHEEIGKYFRKQGMIPEALEEYKTCTRIYPQNPRLHAVLGGIQYNEGDHAAALESFRRVMEADSTFALGLEMMARLHAERSEFAQALRYVRHLAGRPEESAQSAALHGMLAAQTGHLDEAIRAYKRAIRKDPKRIDLAERIAGLALLAEDFEMSEKTYRAILRRRPQSVSARMGLALVIWQPLREDSAAWGGAGSRQRLTEALWLLDGLIEEGEGSARIREWHDGIRAALDRQ